MNLKRMFMTLSLICGTGMTLFAAENQKGIAYYKAGLMDPAKEILLDNVKQGMPMRRRIIIWGTFMSKSRKPIRPFSISKWERPRIRAACSTRSEKPAHS